MPGHTYRPTQPPMQTPPPLAAADQSPRPHRSRHAVGLNQKKDSSLVACCAPPPGRDEREVAWVDGGRRRSEAIQDKLIGWRETWPVLPWAENSNMHHVGPVLRRQRRRRRDVLGILPLYTGRATGPHSFLLCFFACFSLASRPMDRQTCVYVYIAPRCSRGREVKVGREEERRGAQPLLRQLLLVGYIGRPRALRLLGHGALGAGQVDEAVDAEGDEGQHDKQHDDDDGDDVVFLDHGCGGGRSI
ncbi:hypothetical protein F4779DRAFT_212722 [Xylariaceae sp. FL0662B]|nr:hypothetical protein F4779DRAFT_212722 [Xylariaceae sp. FL0662B]